MIGNPMIRRNPPCRFFRLRTAARAFFLLRLRVRERRGAAFLGKKLRRYRLFGLHLQEKCSRRALPPGLAAGFTLIELMVVMLIIAILASIAVPAYVSSIRAAHEAVLKEDLHVMRDAIDAYTNDKNQAPQSLDDLVTAGYLKAIPKDPITHSATTWQTTIDDSIENLDQTEPGISDVHSGSDQVGSDGQPYSSW